MDKKICIFFFQNVNQFDKYILLNEDFYKKKGNIIIALDLELIVLLKEKNIPFKTQSQYITQSEAIEMDKSAFFIAENWYKNYFQYKDINLGELVQVSLKFYFARIIRILHTIINIINVEAPFEIISFKEDKELIKEFNDILILLRDLKNIKLTLIEHPNNYRDLLETKKRNQNIKDLIKRTFKTTKIKILIYILRFLWLLKKLKVKFIHKKIKNVFNFNFGGYHNKIESEASKIYALYTYQGQSFCYKYFYENLKNVFFKISGNFHIYIDAFNSKKIIKKSNQIFNKLVLDWKIIINDSKFKEIFNYQKTSIWPLIKKRIIDTIIQFKDLINSILIVHKLFNDINFILMILAYDNWEMPMLLSEIGSKRGIPTLTIQHGAFGKHISYNRSYSKLICVWGKISKELLRENGIKNDRLVITGCPRFDEHFLLNNNNLTKQKIKKKTYKNFRVKNNKKLIVFASSNALPHLWITSINLNLSEIEKTFDLVLNAIKSLQNCHLIIKLRSHEENEGIILHKLKQLGIKNVSITKHYSIINLIIACDCFITVESTTALEAMIFKKPLICLKFERKDYFLPYFRYNAAYKASNPKELLEKIEKCFNAPYFLMNNYRKLLNDYLYKLDGQSTSRVIKVINSLIDNQ